MTYWKRRIILEQSIQSKSQIVECRPYVIELLEGQKCTIHAILLILTYTYQQYGGTNKIHSSLLTNNKYIFYKQSLIIRYSCKIQMHF